MNHRSSNFTLIELLIVIAIIAILSSILLPSLNSALRKALVVNCTSNLKAIGSAEHMYIGDYEYVVPYNYKPRENGGVSPETPFTNALNGELEPGVMLGPMAFISSPESARVELIDVRRKNGNRTLVRLASGPVVTMVPIPICMLICGLPAKRSGLK